MSEGVPADKIVEIIIDPLPVEGEVIADKNGATLAILLLPGGKILHNDSGLREALMLLPRESAYCQRLGYPFTGDGLHLSIKRLCQAGFNNNSTKANHGILMGDLTVGFDVDDDVTHTLKLIKFTVDKYMKPAELHTNGFTVIDAFFSPEEVQSIAAAIDDADSSSRSFRRTNDLFAIRQFLKEIPGVQSLIFTAKFKALVGQLFGEEYFVVKSIYFDKPEQSNWFVAWHQDLTISVDRKVFLPGFGPWTVKGDQFAVQPPLEILQGMYTIRIHLDDTDEENGALRVIPGSHRHGIQRKLSDANHHHEEICRVAGGGIMIMRPLLQHASNRSTGGKRRRVIHIEFSDAQLPAEMEWAERICLSANERRISS